MAEAERLLQNPAVNIRMGDEYLYKMGQRNQGDLELAAAGYNAGQGGANKYSAAREAGDFSMLPKRMQKETVPYVDKVMQQYAPGIASDMAAGFRIPTGGDEYSDIGADPFEVPPLYQQGAEDAMAALGVTKMPLEGDETISTEVLRKRAENKVEPTPASKVRADSVEGQRRLNNPLYTSVDNSLTRLEPKSSYGTPKMAQDLIPEMDMPPVPNSLWQMPKANEWKDPDSPVNSLMANPSVSDMPLSVGNEQVDRIVNMFHNKELPSDVAYNSLLSLGLNPMEAGAAMDPQKVDTQTLMDYQKENLERGVGYEGDWIDPDNLPYVPKQEQPAPVYEIKKGADGKDVTVPVSDNPQENSLWKNVTDVFSSDEIDAATSWMGEQINNVIDYAIDQVDTDAVKSAAFNYLASRAIGYDHDASAEYATESYKAKANANKEAQGKRQEKALDMLADGKISAAEYSAIVSGDTSIAGAITGGVAGTSGGQPSSLQIKRVINASGGDTDKAPKQFVITAGGKGYAGRVVNAYDSPRGPVFYNQKTGNVETLAEGSYVQYSGDLHDPLEVRTKLNQEMGRYATEHGKEKIAISGEEDGVKTRTSVEKLPVEYNGLVSSVLSRAKNRFGSRGDLMYITPEGGMDIQKYYDAAWAFQQKTGKKVRNWEGFIDSIESGLRDVETGKIRVEQLDVDNEKEYSKLDKEMQRLREKGVPGTDGNRMNRIVSIFNSTKPAELLKSEAFSHLTDEQKKAVLDLRTKAKKKDYKVKEGSSAMMQFAQSYLKLL
jgi:hypothetical protein